MTTPFSGFFNDNFQGVIFNLTPWEGKSQTLGKSQEKKDELETEEHHNLTQ